MAISSIRYVIYFLLTVYVLIQFKMIDIAWVKSLINGSGSAVASNRLCLNIEGFNGCGYFNAAKALGEKIDSTPAPDGREIKVYPTGHERSQWTSKRVPELQKLIPGAGSHRTSPFVYEGCSSSEYKFVGGYTEFSRKYSQKVDN
ncbi:hypothetical protein MP228_002167 [Amoeboaphelidium protococcarum]|nr:hypothetical protein MP228_002167 [Amoeboaphelidium protococcarum]